MPDKYDVVMSTGAVLSIDTVSKIKHAPIRCAHKTWDVHHSWCWKKLAADRVNERIFTPENVPHLFDLTTSKEPKFAPAFYKAVGTTLVANDLDQANRIAFGGAKRWRVVTLAGQLINASGTMSGGGNYVACGGMSSKLEEAQKDLRSVEVEAERLTQAGPNLDMDIEKLPLDIKNGRKRVEGAGQHVRDLKPSTSNLSGGEKASTVIDDVDGDTTALPDTKFFGLAFALHGFKSTPFVSWTILTMLPLTSGACPLLPTTSKIDEECSVYHLTAVTSRGFVPNTFSFMFT
ncbi:hypothetical protein EDC04DRAFT_3143222 [Pisolithus marmoratus]|nr:hypothetical protein EDC04DRAFT_3143222 [Pisolithus marmoratus]